LWGFDETAVQEIRYKNVILIDVVEGRTGRQSYLNTVVNLPVPFKARNSV